MAGKSCSTQKKIVKTESGKGDLNGKEHCVIYYYEKGEITSVEVSGTMEELQETLNQTVL